ncbi:MAG: hypothetical protein U0996_23940 [Planctomycetaceae bacterium]
MSAPQSIQRGILHQVMCLLVCIAAWRGPMPVLHDHASAASSGQLQEHCQNFHGNGSADCCGLHFHFALPRDVYGDSCPDSDKTIPEITTFACAAGSCQLQVFADDLTHWVDPGAMTASIVQDRQDYREDSSGHHLRSFLSTLCISRPMSAVTTSWLL